MIILGIETSCDDTCIGILNSEGNILANIRESQYDIHHEYGGVVPNLAAEGHLKNICNVYKAALQEANITPKDIDLVAVTTRPGLVTGLAIGAVFAKLIASDLQIPIIDIHHLIGHSVMPLLQNQAISYPFLLLLISGGHTQLLLANSITNYDLIGQTLDDSIGECFDKTAKMLNLDRISGSEIEKLAMSGNKNAFRIPLSMYNQPHANFSFSGIKTHIRKLIQENDETHGNNFAANLCASLQHAAAQILVNRIEASISLRNLKNIPIIVSGGVAANLYIREYLQTHLQNWNIYFPEVAYSTDNGVMIAWAGYLSFLENGPGDIRCDIYSSESL